jgi:septal ring factor EnvC (AmiA/AmiB activator)
MKNFHQNLLIVLALSLCGLCVWQWYSQTLQRNRLENLNRMLAEKSTAIAGYTNSLATLNHQIEQMDGTITALKTAAAANDAASLAQKREINRLQLITEVMTNEIRQYTNAVTTLETKLQDLADGVKRQNTAIAELTTQRDDFIQKLNDSIKDRNAIVAKYNDLVKQIDKSSQNGNKEH